ncbi:glycohydrolase toxin TNT-related protein [Saccharopolyspora phatthalungensis]|uniref:glycohydrolase toxin TNT-related protein n=1 Tax=Saccharopolyspora phatthalungensis TaxID=664693 RepID=UPI0016146DFC
MAAEGAASEAKSVRPAAATGRDYRRHRVCTGFQVISGVAKPAYGQFGGGTAAVLPGHRRLARRGLRPARGLACGVTVRCDASRLAGRPCHGG